MILYGSFSLLPIFTGIGGLWAFPVNLLSLAAPDQWFPVFLLYVSLYTTTQPYSAATVLHTKTLHRFIHMHERLVLSMVSGQGHFYQEESVLAAQKWIWGFTEQKVISGREGMQYTSAGETLSGTLGPEEWTVVTVDGIRYCIILEHGSHPWYPGSLVEPWLPEICT